MAWDNFVTHDVNNHDEKRSANLVPQVTLDFDKFNKLGDTHLSKQKY